MQARIATRLIDGNACIKVSADEINLYGNAVGIQKHGFLKAGVDQLYWQNATRATLGQWLHYVYRMSHEAARCPDISPQGCPRELNIM